jgi:hypothetical protein
MSNVRNVGGLGNLAGAGLSSTTGLSNRPLPGSAVSTDEDRSEQPSLHRAERLVR